MGYRLRKHLTTSPRSFPVLLRRIACVVVLLGFMGAAFLPLTAHAFFGEFTIKDEIELGRKFNSMIRSSMPMVQDPEIVEYVEDIVKKLTKNMPPQPLPFTSGVINHNALNAFAIPGGYIYVYTGLFLSFEHESEVAGVIAHELAHVTQRHVASRIQKGQIIGLMSLLGALAGAFIGGDGGGAAMMGATAAGQAAMLSYSRADESEADQVGMNYLIKGGYPPQGFVGAFSIMSRRQWIMGGSIPTYLSTHPGLSERVQDMSVRIQKMPAAIRNKKDDDTRFLRVQVLIRARYGDPQPAYQTFQEQLQGPNRCLALLGLGILSSRQNKINDAAGYFNDALTCLPNDALVLREAGRFHYTKGNRNKGAELLQRAVSLNRDDIMALFYYARSLGDSGQTAKAVEYTEQVLRKVPEDAEVHTLLARYYAQNKQMFEANLHMAYAAVYENNPKKVKQFLPKAKDAAKTPAQKSRLERFENIYSERKEFLEP